MKFMKVRVKNTKDPKTASILGDGFCSKEVMNMERMG